MKRFLYISLYLFFLSFFSHAAFGQSCDPSSFGVVATPAPSTCQSNGTVTVTLTGDIGTWTTIQYGLSTHGDPLGFAIQPNGNHVLSNIPPGIYDITVRAFCPSSDSWSPVKTIQQVTVGGTYRVPEAAFSPGASRKPYAHCATGIIALNVTKGSGNYIFEIIEAPAGVALGVIAVTKDGDNYILNGENYPAGNYKIEIKDGCDYKKIVSFTFNAITGYPTLKTHYYSFTHIDPYNSCSLVNWSILDSNNPITNGDYLRYYNDGMYELSMSVGADVPNNWATWVVTSNVAKQMQFDIAPRQFSDAYAENSLKLNIRLKGCSESQSFSSKLNGSSPIQTSLSIADCDGYVYTIKANKTSINAIFCYPYSIEIKDGNTVIGNITGISAFDEVTTPRLQYNKNYYYTVKDANGLTLDSRNFNEQIRPGSFAIVNKCNGYNIKFTPPSICFPLNVTIKKTNEGTIVYNGQINSSSLFPASGLDLEYGVDYTISAVAVNNSQFFYTHRFSVSNPAYTLAAFLSPKSGVNTCEENKGYLQVSASNTFWTSLGSYSYNFTRWLPNTTIKVMDSSPISGYTGNVYTPSSSSSYDLPVTDLPSGTYTVEVDDKCSLPKLIQVNYAGGYNASDFNYTTQNVACVGLKVFPTGSLKMGNTATTTYYRLMSGPSGYDKNTVITTGGHFILSLKGTYKIGIMRTNSSTACAFREIQVDYNPDPLALNSLKTAAYLCDEETVGHIMVTAINGGSPYTYQLWNREGTTKLAADIITAGEAHFNYGAASGKYLIKVIDACNSSFTQTVDMVDLATARIVFSQNNGMLCKGGTIQLNCITLGTTNYNWTGPNGWSAANTQNPSIANAQVNMTGWYKVGVQPEFCGKVMYDSVYITVNDLPAAPVLTTTSIGYCMGAGSQTLAVASGAVALAGHTLKWYGSDGVAVITPSLINTTAVGTFVYYVSQVNTATGCESAKVEITVVIHPLPTVPFVDNNLSSVCPNDMIMITINATTVGYAYTLYDQAVGGSIIAERPGSGGGLHIPISAPPFPTTYSVTAKNEFACESPRSLINILVNPSATPANITANDVIICPNTFTTLTASSTPDVDNPDFKWYDSQMSTTVLAVGSSFTTPILNETTTYYVSVAGANYCENLMGLRKPVTVTIRETVLAYPEIRVQACPQNSINLTKYVNTLDLVSIKWTPASSFNSGGINNGVLTDATNLVAGKIYIYKYEATNNCIVGNGKLYLTVPKNNKVQVIVDDVKVCHSDASASAIQLNPMFGIESGNGTWACNPAVANSYLTVSSLAPNIGAVVFNGKAAWANSSIPFNGDGDKVIEVTYTPSLGTCLSGESYTVKIILTADVVH